jgi:hypothetical protein
MLVKFCAALKTGPDPVDVNDPLTETPDPVQLAVTRNQSKVSVRLMVLVVLVVPLYVSRTAEDPPFAFLMPSTTIDNVTGDPPIT